MKRPDKYQYLFHGINAAQIMAEYDKYCDYLEAQLKEEKKILIKFDQWLHDVSIENSKKTVAEFLNEIKEDEN